MNDSIHDDYEESTVNTSKTVITTPDPNVLHIYEKGELTVIGFGGKDVPDEVCIAAYRKQLFELVEDSQCKVLAFDLTGVTFLPSGMLGVLTSLRKKVDRLEIYNPSTDIRDVLRMTKLETLFDIKDIELG